MICWNSTENPPLICTRNETINENKFIYIIRFLPITRTTEAIIVWYSPQKFQIIKIDGVEIPNYDDNALYKIHQLCLILKI